MKIVCSKSNLVTGVNIVSKAVSSKTSLSILECILIVASNGVIKLLANDMEMGIETRIQGEIEENGMIALDAKIFGDVVRRFPNDFIRIVTDDKLMARITCLKSKFNLPGKSGDDFTYLPKVDKEESITISQFTLKQVIQQTLFSISENDNNKLMTGELFDINGDSLRVVSLDGHRISIRNIGLRQKYDKRRVVVPGKTLGEISKILSGEVEKEVNLYFMKNNIAFQFDDTTVVSRIIEGEYFNIDQMLNENFDTKMEVNKRDLLECIERAVLLIKEGDKKPIIMQIMDNALELKINSTIGSMDEEVEIEKLGRDLLIGFNPRFLIDVLRVVEDERITMYYMGSKSPCFIRDEENKYIYVVLPVNFNPVM
ncbi:MAG: DNA polymerase III subunit beta [Lachnospiraceae bacterium]|nr:DNA polymerase III subunit beta [Lachnospiraceae bacterium]